MAQEKKDWGTLVRSIKRRRAPQARFFKPVCVIAAIDLADAGKLDSDLLHSELIIRRFADYVAPIFPDRASSGWQPLWFLTNDALWNFSHKGKALSKSTFEHGVPRSKAALFAKFDAQVIAPAYRSLWESSARRSELRNEMLLLLADDPDCRALIPPLFNPMEAGSPANWPTDAQIAEYLESVRKQPDLFRASDPTSGMDRGRAREEILEFEIDELPAATALGPAFAVSGDAPISLAQYPVPPLTAIQFELLQILRDKCEQFQTLVPATRNRTAYLAIAVTAFRHALGNSASVGNNHVVWSHANTLRRLNDADLRARSSHDPETQPLPEEVGELLTDLVEQFNVYASGNELLRKFDHARVGPAGRAELIEQLRAGGSLLRAIADAPQIMDPAASNLLATTTGVAEAATGSVGIDADQAIVNAVEIQRNGAQALLRSALLEAKKWGAKVGKTSKLVLEGGLKQAGAELAKQLPFSSFVASCKGYLALLWKGQSGSEIVDHVISLLRKLIQ